MRLIAFACLLFGLVLTVAAWWHVTQSIDKEAARDFDRFSAHADAGIEDRARSHLYAIADFQGLFTVSNTVSRKEFHDHFQRLNGGRWHPGLVAVQYLQRTTEADRVALEAGIRSDASIVDGGYPGFSIEPPGTRDDYLVTKYSEPMLDGMLALGHDSATRRALDPVLASAAESGSPVATPPEALTEVSQGISVYYAVYARGHPLDTAKDRRAAVRGYVRGIFRTSGMFDDVLPQVQADGYRVWIEDLGGSGAGDPATVLFDSDVSTSDPGNARAVQEHTYALVIGERTWMVHTTRPLANATLAPWPMTVLGGGIVLSFGVWAMLWIVSAQYGRASRMAHHLSREAGESAMHLRSVIDHSADGIVTIDARSNLLSVNPAAQRMFGYTSAQLVGRPLSDLFDESRRAEVRVWLKPYAGHSVIGGREREELAVREDGTHFPLTMNFSAMDGPEHGLRVGILRDVSERRQIESRMQHMARHDALTALPNRLLLLERLQEAIAAATPQTGATLQPRVGLMFIDLDRFKNINDSLGHHVGDSLLTEVALRLQSVVRTGDTSRGWAATSS